MTWATSSVLHPEVLYCPRITAMKAASILDRRSNRVRSRKPKSSLARALAVPPSIISRRLAAAAKAAALVVVLGYWR